MKIEIDPDAHDRTDLWEAEMQRVSLLVAGLLPDAVPEHGTICAHAAWRVGAVRLLLSDENNWRVYGWDEFEKNGFNARSYGGSEPDVLVTRMVARLNRLSLISQI